MTGTAFERGIEMAIQVEDLCYTYGEGTALEQPGIKARKF